MPGKKKPVIPKTDDFRTFNIKERHLLFQTILHHPRLQEVYEPDEILDLINDGYEFPKVCPHCGNVAKIADSSIVYGRKYAGVGLNLLICSNFPVCDSYVGLHKSGLHEGEPLGTLANRELREYRKISHSLFDKLWRDGGMDRHEAYDMLADLLKIDRQAAHIAMLNIDQCKELINYLNELDKTKSPKPKRNTGRGWGNVPTR